LRITVLRAPEIKNLTYNNWMFPKTYEESLV